MKLGVLIVSWIQVLGLGVAASRKISNSQLSYSHDLEKNVNLTLEDDPHRGLIFPEGIVRKVFVALKSLDCWGLSGIELFVCFLLSIFLPIFEKKDDDALYQESIEDNTLSSSRDLLYLGNDMIFELPSFKPFSNCSIPPHPVKGIIIAVTGLVDDKIMTCGGRDSSYNKESSCHKLDGGTWIPQPDTKNRVSYFAAASQTREGYMMVTGGKTGTHHGDVLSSTELFINGEWEEGPALPVKMANHCQVTSKSGVIVAGRDWQNTNYRFQVFRQEDGQWNKIAEREWSTPYEWTYRFGHSCQVLSNERLAVIGGLQYSQRVDILDLTNFTWSEGPKLPVEIYNDLSIIYQDIIYVIDGENGDVYSIPESLVGEWSKVASLGSIPWRQVFPALIVQEKNVC